MLAKCCTRNCWVKSRAAVCPMISHIVAGVFYSYSNTNSYVAKWLDKKPEDTIIVQQIWMVAMVLLVVATPKLSNKIDYWWLNLIAMIGMSLTHLVASFLREYYSFIIIYSLFAGIFGGMCYLPALYITWQYFPEKKSILTGCVVFCIGISGMIFSAISTAVVNPDNLKPSHPDYGLRVPWLYQLYTILFGVIGVGSGLLMPKPLRDPPKDTAKIENKNKLENYSDNEKGLEKSQTVPAQGLVTPTEKKFIPINTKSKKIDCPSIWVAFRVKELYILLFIAFFGALYPLFMNSNWKILYTVKLPSISDRDLAIILSVGSASSALIRIAVGLLLLKVPVKVILAVQVGFSIFGAFTIGSLLVNYGAAIMFILLSFGSLGSQNTLMPMACTQIFGDKVGRDIYPIMFFMFGMANFGQYAIFRLSSDGKQFNTMFYILGALSATCTVLCFFINMNPKWPEVKTNAKLKEMKGSPDTPKIKDDQVEPDNERAVLS